MNFIAVLLPAIEHFHSIGYWIAFFAALLETTIGIGLLIPGSSIVLFMGALAGNGFFDIGDLLWFLVVGAFIGDNINYYIGKRFGSKIFSKGFWFIKPSHFKTGEAFFEKHGPKSVFIGRFIPSLKEVIPLIAGTFGMRRVPFAVWNIFGSIGWSLAWALPGYFFAQSLSLAQIWLTRAGFFLIIFLLVFVLVYILKVYFVKKGKRFFSFLFSVWLSVKEAIKENHEVQKLTEKYPTIFKFIGKRIDKNNFYGLPLTFFLFSLIYVFFLFGGIIEDIINSEVILSTDIRLENLLMVFQTPELIRFFFWVSLLGKWEIVLIFTVVVIIIFWIWGKRVYITPLLLSIVGSELFAFVGKVVIHRARPDVAIYAENSFSFPSGHATIAVAFYGFITYALIKNLKQWNKKINAFFIGFILIALIGFSRLYLGVHYMSDVWGGYLVGTIWLIIAISLLEYLLYKKSTTTNVLLSYTKKRLITYGLIVFSVILYAIFAFNYKTPILTLPKETNETVINDMSVIFTNDQLKYTETIFGDQQEPLSFIIVARNNQEFIDLFERAGWSLADEVNFSSVVKMTEAIFWKQPYVEAPMTPDFWNTKVHDFGFEKLTQLNKVSERHHARFWRTNYLTIKGDMIYVGTASFDSGLKWGVTHKINPDIDTEREFLLNDLQRTGIVSNFEQKQLVNPKLGSNFSGDVFFTDGKLYLMYAN